MVIVLIGSSQSDPIIKASKYLAGKYLPSFPRIYLKYDGELEFWSKYVADFMECLTEELVMFGMDDFLFANDYKYEIFNNGLWETQVDKDIVCVKLCKSTEEEHKEYPVTTQLCIWNREYLIWLLRQTNSPWNFERRGSQLFDKKCILRTCIDYDCNSSTSFRWEGYRLNGLKESDIEFLKTNNYLL